MWAADSARRLQSKSGVAADAAAMAEIGLRRRTEPGEGLTGAWCRPCLTLVGMLDGTRSTALSSVDDALIRLRRLWSASRQRAVDEHGNAVEMSSLLVIEACARGSEAGREVSVGDVAAWADVAASTASRLVDRAVSVGLISRRPSEKDSRRVSLTLTARGRALRQHAVQARNEWLADQLDGWEDRDVAAFGGLLARFADRAIPPAHFPAPDDGR